MATSSATIGGDIIAILVQQSLRQAIMYGAALSAQNYQSPPIFIAGVPVTARLQEVYRYRAEVTRFAIEDARYASDHVILYPLEIELRCEIGNWYPGMAGYSLELFKRIFGSRNLLTLITEHKQVQNMVLRECRAENEAPKWGKLDCHLTFQEIPVVAVGTQPYTTEQVSPTPATSTPAATNSATPPVDQGQTSPQVPTTNQIGNFNLPSGSAVG